MTRSTIRSAPGLGTAVRVVLIALVLAMSASVDAFRPQTDYAAHFASGAGTRSGITIQTPVELAKSFAIRFDVKLGRGGHGNVLLTSGLSGTSLQLYVGQAAQLYVELFQMVTPVAFYQLDLHRWHHVELRKFADGRFYVSVDGQRRWFNVYALQQSQSSAEIGAKDFAFRFGTVSIGPDIGAMRGKIANFSFNARYVPMLAPPLALLLDAIIGIIIVWAAWPWLSLLRFSEGRPSDVIVLAAVAAAAACGFTAYALHFPGGHWSILGAIAAGALIGGALCARVSRKRIPRWAGLAVACIGTSFVCLSLLTLPNWVTTARMFWRWPLTSMAVLVIVLCACTYIVIPRRSAKALRLAPLLPYLLFALLALRTDSLVAPINALHWDYVLGPIRALREGGWLLWDVPSQYGFLNVLIPALLPIHPVMEAFYCFQAMTFFAASSVFYRTLHAVFRVPWLIAALLVVVFFFFSDPLLIGPAPYPSMSAVRFLWCYVLLAIVAANFLGPRPSVDRFVRSATAAWIVSLLWSAESALYGSAIFFMPIFLSLLRSRNDPRSVRSAPAMQTLALPLIYAAAAFCAADIFYLAHFGHDADWAMYPMYIVGYGSGFGSEAIPFVGPYGIVIAILAGGAAVFVATRRAGKEGPSYAAAAAFAMTWIVSTYYLGRAFPVVITTLLPLLIFAAFAMIRAGTSIARVPLIAAFCVPLVAVGVTSTFWNADMPVTAPRLAHVDLNAWAGFPQPDPELAALLRDARIGPSVPVVYYDAWIAMPRAADGPFDRNFLPTPLGALEAPIPEAKRNQIIGRFIHDHPLSGYFIQRFDSATDPKMAQAWINLLSRYYVVRPVAASRHYRVLQLSLRMAPSA